MLNLIINEVWSLYLTEYKKNDFDLCLFRGDDDYKLLQGEFYYGVRFY
jgi:hypothetical protein